MRMRILGFSKQWQKLSQPTFTTFRFTKKDRDWAVGELVKIVYKPRSKKRKGLGIAQITQIELRKLGTAFEQFQPTEREAIEDGFTNLKEMNEWFSEVYGGRVFSEPLNKLSLKWE